MHGHNRHVTPLALNVQPPQEQALEIAGPLNLSLQRLDPRRVAQRALALAADAQQVIAEQAQRIRHLESLSQSDELTGLLNRRGFQQAFRRALDLAQRHGEEGVLCLIDLDGFKLVNDTFGHAAGDMVLRRVADILRCFTRDSDLVARLGGDEFAALLVHAKADDAERRALQVKCELNRANAVYGGRIVPIKASLGVIRYGPEADPSALLRAADQAMYGDKRSRQRDGCL